MLSLSKHRLELHLEIGVYATPLGQFYKSSIFYKDVTPPG